MDGWLSWRGAPHDGARPMGPRSNLLRGTIMDLYALMWVPLRIVSLGETSSSTLRHIRPLGSLCYVFGDIDGRQLADRRLD